MLPRPTAITTLNLWLAINDCGDSYVSTESPSDALTELLNENACQTARVVKLTLSIPTPKIPEARVDIPAVDARTAGVDGELSRWTGRFWPILTSFLGGYCVRETIRLIQEIRAYRRAQSFKTNRRSDRTRAAVTRR